MSVSSSFDLLSYGVQRWVYRQGWGGLREVQEAAVPVILKGEQDVLLSAPTAGGKTEAAFLPLVSWLEESGPEYGFGVLCLSPLKALINDQYQRLELLCESAGTEITPWHGDVSGSLKKRQWRRPRGLLMITPESLEAMFVLRPHELKDRMQGVRYVVIDEFHAFIGRERGQQLLSQLSRLEQLINKPLCRIALSATIGDPTIALSYLRPDQSRPGLHLEVPHEPMNLKLSLNTYPASDDAPVTEAMAADLYRWLRGSSHLVFANARAVVEEMTDYLAQFSKRESVPLEFFAHHGSLSKDARHYVEQRLKEGEKPTTAIATSTLELGIDVGDVTSVAQVRAPANVSSIRQRLGRSGRREGTSSILRLLVATAGDQKNPCPIDILEAELFQTMAVVDLMLQRWLEPPDEHSLHLSTLIQQILSMIAYTGGIRANEAYQTLCVHGPWHHLGTEVFARVLRGLGEKKVIRQLDNGELIVDIVGERLISHYSFYTAFEVPEEYRLMANGRNLGSLPITVPYMPGQYLLFAGKRWLIEAVDDEAKVILLRSAPGGLAPIFGGEKAPVHGKIRQRMKELYETGETPAYINNTTEDSVARARAYYANNALSQTPCVRDSGDLYWFVWENDRVLNTIAAACTLLEFKAYINGPCVIVQQCRDLQGVANAARNLLQDMSIEELEKRVPSAPLGKFDQHLPSSLIQHAFVREVLDIDQTKSYLSHLVNTF